MKSVEICAACEADLPYILNPCTNCGLPHPDPEWQGCCTRCLLNPPAFNTCTAPLEYRMPVQRLHHLFKFRQNIGAGQLLSDLLGNAIMCRQLSKPDLLVPVPIHWHRRLQRGFNQAEIICQALCVRLGLSMTHALKRIRADAPQQSLSRKARMANVAGTFLVRPRSIPMLAGRHLALVDDIYTTGATATTATQTLLRAGAAKVDLWCLARTVV